MPQFETNKLKERYMQIGSVLRQRTESTDQDSQSVHSAEFCRHHQIVTHSHASVLVSQAFAYCCLNYVAALKSYLMEV